MSGKALVKKGRRWNNAAIVSEDKQALKAPFLPPVLWTIPAIFLICIVSARPLTFLPGVAGLVGLCWLFLSDRTALRQGYSASIRVFALFLVAVLGIEAASLLSRISAEGQTLKDVVKLAGLFLSGSFFLYFVRSLSVDDRPAFGFLAMAGGFLGVALLAEQALHFPLFRLAKNMSGAVEINPSELNKRAAVFFLVLPSLLVFARQWKDFPLQRGMAFALCLAPLFLLYVSTESQAAQLALPLMGCVWLVSRYAPRLTLAVVVIGMAAYMLAAPFLFPLAYDYVQTLIPEGRSDVWQAASVMPRLELWAFIGETIQQRLLTGYGIDAARHLPRDEWEWRYFTNVILYHPHNAVLQIWLETGITGISLALVGLAGLYRSLSKLAVPALRLAMTVLVGCAVFAIVSWGLWQSWWLGALFFVAGMTLLAMRILERESNKVTA